MSSSLEAGLTTQPIPPAAFALAIADLPLDTLHAKAAEIRNSIAHLRSSNQQMLPFADAGDQDCKEAMFENLAVIGRMNERVGLLRAEVEGRGMLWGQEGDIDAEDGGVNGVHGVHGGKDLVDGEGEGIVVNGVGRAGNEVNGANGMSAEGSTSAQTRSGRLTDEELRRRMEAQMGGDEEENEEEGVHL